MTKKTAIVTGITGQDGSYLSELLLQSNYTVIACRRRSSTNNLERVTHLLDDPNFILTEFDLTDPSGVYQTIQKYQPDEFYNLAAQSHVGTSFKQPSTTFEINTVGVTNILEGIRHYSPHTKLYQASTSEMFGRNYSTETDGKRYQNEKTEMLPQSPYGIAKLAAHNMVEIYRSGYNLFACCGILFNHESPRRGENFVTQKIVKWIKDYIASGKSPDFPKLKLGNLAAHRDWGHAKDYVRAMWMMLQQETPKDYVIATGETHSVQEFLDLAFKSVQLNPEDHVEIDPDLFRPAEVEYLCGDPTFANNDLGWNPQVSFEGLIQDMLGS
ncbi:MAG: GDP-mannose 4,6-dehydratase [Flavobacteriales bacterium]|nr:GDP-mannose 4,6-dehydratase [Flavobacteriales bacterium]|tara:strand:+ start:5073 stop:6053 length:981 start_codon:yes stop_codon:yes gene_type:complete